jgi:hypothetical protein
MLHFVVLKSSQSLCDIAFVEGQQKNKEMKVKVSKMDQFLRIYKKVGDSYSG